jgi:hypothetical protein
VRADDDSVLRNADRVISAAFQELQSDARDAQRGAGTRVADSLFALASRRFRARIDTIASSLWDNGPLQKSLLDRTDLLDSLENAWAPRGVRISSSEGSYFPAVNASALVEPFLPSLSPQGKQYLVARVADESVPLSDDAALLISWHDLAKRVAHWETLSDSLRGSLFENEASQWHTIYRGILFTGLDNSSVFDWQTGLVRPQLRDVYQFAQDSLARYQVGVDARDFLALLEREAWRETAAVKAFIVERRVRSMQAMQPPSR